MTEKDYLHDMRVVQRYISEGNISEKDHEKYIKDLEDVSDKSEVLIIEEESEEELNTEETDEDEMGI